MTNPSAFYDSITLTEEEIKEALLEGRKKKYFKEKNKEYWEAQEKTKSKTNIRYAKSTS
jgi:hypothetical protein